MGMKDLDCRGTLEVIINSSFQPQLFLFVDRRGFSEV